MKVDPLFGTLMSWRGIDGAPSGAAPEIAQQLRVMVEAHYQSSASWPIPQPLVRLMILELAVHFGFSARPLSGNMLWLLAWAMDVAPTAVEDPGTYIAGGWKGGRKPGVPEAFSRAFFADAEHFKIHGALMSGNALRTQLVSLFGERAPQRSTLRLWQERYRDLIENGVDPVAKPD